MPQAILRSTCEFNTKYFPFDENECHLKFGSWTHDGNQLDLQFYDGKEKFLVDDFVIGNEWDLVGNRGERNVKIYECCKDTPYLDLKFYITLKRKTAFYSFILLTPCTLLSCLTLVIFWVPPESPAKLMLGELSSTFFIVSKIHLCFLIHLCTFISSFNWIWIQHVSLQHSLWFSIRKRLSMQVSTLFRAFYQVCSLAIKNFSVCNFLQR